MGLRVLDDDRPGFALLAFDGSSDRPSLSISIRSLRENAYLGPDGAWQKTPHYFTAELASGDARQTLYRVGPEIVNHLLEHDRIGVASADGSVQEEALWENAIPQMLGQSRHSIYRAPSNVVNQVKVTRVEPPKPKEDEPQPAIEPAETRLPVPVPKPVVVPPKPLWQKLLPLVLIVAAALVAAGVPQVRCKLLGISCPAPAPAPTPIPVPPDDTLRLASACAAAKRAADPCEVRACFADYLAKTPADKVAASAKTILEDGEAACLEQRRREDSEKRRREESEKQARIRRAEEERALQSARQCAAGATDCIVKNCYGSYLTEYGNLGALRDQARAEVAAAEARCKPPPDLPSPPSVSALADGTYNAGARRGCGASAQFGIHVTVKSGSVSWEHEFRGIRYTWSGTIDGQGNIRASVGNSNSFSATGHYSDTERDVQMRYPQCGADMITLSIIGRL